MTGRRIVVVVATGVAAATLVGLSTAATGPRSETARAVSKPVKQSPAGTISSSGAGQSANDAAGYWTKARMDAARPTGKTVSGAAPRPSAGPAVEGASSAAAPQRSAPAKKTAAPKRGAKERTSSQGDGVTSSPDSAGNAAAHWTQDAMDSAQPAMPSPADPGEPAPGTGSQPPIVGVPGGTP